jgi:threonine synthase
MGVIARYRERLPVTDRTPLIDLCEGSTPLIPSRNIGPALGLRRLFFKYEGLNPTGSFKDRGMVVAVAKAMEDGARVLVCASTGNTSASAAAYAASKRLRAIVLIPSGQIAMNKLAQAMLYGAKVVAISGNFDDALRTVREMADDYPIAVVNSINPYRIEGQKTAAFEVLEELGPELDALCIPVGNAGNITAYWKGFTEAERRPRMLGFQAAGAAPLVHGAPVEHPETVASAIRIGNPARWEEAMNAMTTSGGAVEAVTDEQILSAYRLLAAEEGVFCEPASAASVAGLINHGAGDAQTIVCVLTGHGLKDPDLALQQAGAIIPCGSELAAIERAVLG